MVGVIIVIVQIANVALLAAILWLHQRRDEQLRDLLYGWVAGFATAVFISFFGLNVSLVRGPLEELAVIGFWTMGLLFTNVRQVKPEAAGRPLLLNVMGIILGLAPANYAAVSLMTGAKPPAQETVLPMLILFGFLLTWLALSAGRLHLDHALFYFGLSVTSLPWVFGRLAASFSNLVHNLFHLFSVVWLFPDHPYLKLWVYKLVVFIFKPVFGTVLAVIVLALPAGLLLARRSWTYLEKDWGMGPVRRKEKAGFRSTLRRQALFVTTVFLAAAGIAGAAQSKTTDTDAPPQPALIDKGVVLIAESNPFTRMKNNRIKKFYVERSGRRIVFMAVKRDGRYLAALDACAICGDKEGYSQTKTGDLICNFCSSVIALDSFGLEGGCNPVPLKVKQAPSALTISLREIDNQYGSIKRAKGANK